MNGDLNHDVGAGKDAWRMKGFTEPKDACDYIGLWRRENKKALHSIQPASLHTPEYPRRHVEQRRSERGFAFLLHAVHTRKWLSTTPTPSPDKDNEIGWICETAKSVAAAAAAQRLASAFKGFMFYLCTRIAGCLLLCRLYIIPWKSSAAN